MKNIYLIGGGGHCRSCIDVIELEKKFLIKGIFDKQENVGKNVFEYPIIANDLQIKDYISSENYFLITIGQIKFNENRLRFFELLKENNANIATIISPRAHIAKNAKLGIGTIVLHDVLVNSNAIIGENCIINSKALIEHDAQVGHNCHISTAANVNGGCIIGDNSFIGSNSTLLHGINIPSNSMIQAGSFYRGKE